MVGRPIAGQMRGLASFGMVLLLAACGSRPAAKEPSTPIPTIPTVAPSPAQSGSGLTFTNQNWGAVAQDPEKYVGANVHLTGQVFNLEEDQTRVAIQIWTDPLHGEGNTVVVFPKAGFPSVAKGDQVQVAGQLVSLFAGVNDSGSPLKLPKVEATRLSVLSHSSPQPSPSSSVEGVNTRRPLPATATPRPAPTATPRPIAPGRFRVVGTGRGGLSVRTGPVISARKLGVVHEGGMLQVIAQAAPGWAEVLGANFRGYVSRDYLAGPVAGPANQVLGKLEPK